VLRLGKSKNLRARVRHLRAALSMPSVPCSLPLSPSSTPISPLPVESSIPAHALFALEFTPLYPT